MSNQGNTGLNTRTQKSFGGNFFDQMGSYAHLAGSTLQHLTSFDPSNPPVNTGIPSQMRGSMREAYANMQKRGGTAINYSDYGQNNASAELLFGRTQVTPTADGKGFVADDRFNFNEVDKNSTTGMKGNTVEGQIKGLQSAWGAGNLPKIAEQLGAVATAYKERAMGDKMLDASPKNKVYVPFKEPSFLEQVGNFVGGKTPMGGEINRTAPAQGDHSPVFSDRYALGDKPSSVGSQPQQLSSNYVVKSGDNLTDIAGRLGITPEELAKQNNIRNPNMIQPGQTFKYNSPITKAKKDGLNAFLR